MARKFLAIIIVVIMLTPPISGQADAQHDALMESIRQSNQLRAEQERRWLELSERERYMRHNANQAAYWFRRTYGRFPNPSDRQFVAEAMRRVGVSTQEDAWAFQEELFSHYRYYAIPENVQRDRAICNALPSLGMSPESLDFCR